jgi:hypothetical protein
MLTTSAVLALSAPLRCATVRIIILYSHMTRLLGVAFMWMAFSKTVPQPERQQTLLITLRPQSVLADGVPVNTFGAVI